MAKHKPDVTRTKKPQKLGQAEVAPNPHNEANVIEMPVRTDQSDQTGGRNVGQTPSTPEGRLHPSVAEGVTGGVADTDSMFNNADPQASPAGASRSETARRGDRKKKA